MKCKECEFEKFEQLNGGSNRYYCTHPQTTAGVGAVMISRTERGSEERKHKTAPKWCPFRRTAKTADTKD